VPTQVVREESATIDNFRFVHRDDFPALRGALLQDYPHRSASASPGIRQQFA